MERLLKRKIDDWLLAWKRNPDRKPLIVKGARPIGKIKSIEHFADLHEFIPGESLFFFDELQVWDCATSLKFF